MLELLLLRHAKARRGEPAGEDHDRELAPQGEKAARAMGQLIARLDLLPDRVLCSTATRARRTYELARQDFPAMPEAEELRFLYMAAPSRLLAVTRRQPVAASRLLIIGHNPGLHGLAALLAGRGDRAGLARLREKFATAALAVLRFDVRSWPDVAPGEGELVGYWCPRALE